ncbi:hypothetical protein ACFQMA_09255 [Halosimplex aquaticum]|uniref:Sec-independent protein translocase protein TatA n=1 Tax=Halosimplex aquaticum TaxID=3026162 RepID=A0ABD5Y6J1_9EURY|nr:hypothetical protein [Halosimplex aquaticum]
MTVPEVPTPSAKVLGIVLLAFLGGMAVPTRYGLLRLRGFGRLFASKIPAKPPAGMEREQWLRQADAPLARGHPDGGAEVEAGADQGDADSGSGQTPPRDETGKFTSGGN